MAIAALAVLAISIGVMAAGVSAEGDEPIPQKRELKYPTLGSRLNDLVVRVEEGKPLPRKPQSAQRCTGKGRWR